MQRTFLLYTYGAEVPPQGPVRKLGWIPGARPVARVMLQGGEGLLIIGEPGREIAEQRISDVAARALLEAAHPRVAVAEEDASDDWRVRQYEGPQWGVVTGVTETRRADDPVPPAPTGWRLGREITGTPGADEARLATMSHEELAEYKTIR